MKKILITGGAGFIGSNFIRHILAKYPNYCVTNLDKLTYCGNLENLKDVTKNKNYKFVKGDIADPKVVNQFVKGADLILNFAAETHVDRSIKDPVEFLRTNVFGTHTLLEAAKAYSTKLFIQISTDEVYGSISKGAFTEASPIAPNSPYSAAKAGGDLLARSYFITHGLPVIITRSSNNFGPYQYPEKVIPLFVTNLLEGKKVPLYADGSNVRDWLFVIDNCEAIDVIMHKGKAGEVYNIGGGNEITNMELTKILIKLLDRGEEYIEFVKDRLGHDKRYSLDISKIKTLGWKPRHDFKDALELTVNWYTKNKSWWKRLIKCREDIPALCSSYSAGSRQR
ncbi:MAG: dTDP-glucose 4,6-dehydratase [Candidatus Omnitrophica bacterium]|nr:dTDP-glucose 4,6-dehydratase [Candidatus Omnitrophota bacterium]